MTSSPTLPSAAGWIDLINESVHTSDDLDIGDIEAANKNFVVVKEVLSISITTISLSQR